MKLFTIYLLASAFLPISSFAQTYWDDEEATTTKKDLSENLQYKIETQASFSKGKTPLWLNANKYGLSSLEKTNGYLRGSLMRPLRTDSARRWGIGYGVDVAVAHHYTSRMVVQQAFAEVRWLHGVLTVGAKEYPMELKNQTLSSGSQTLGINARPVPQVRLALPDYWTLPFGHHWLHLKGHVAYGKMTDDNWQHEFTQRKAKYADGILYHSKAGYLKIGNEDAFFPLSVEMGLEMATQFGGTPYYIDENGQLKANQADKGLKAFWNAFVPGGSDATDGEYANVAGNMLGSWLLRINYETDMWMLHLYADHFFEDHSQMFFLDFDGYGEGENWNNHVKRRYYLYKLKDMMLGVELNIKHGSWLRNIVFEYLYTKHQSGPYNHDHTQNIPDHLAGMDTYYNHKNYNGWQHWGQVMGNPLYRSPIYNDNGRIEVRDNRFIAYHLGFDGLVGNHADYRVLATYQNGWGSYQEPFYKMHHNVSFLVEGSYHFRYGWNARLGYGMDFGSEQMLGHNAGVQVTVSKQGLLNFKKRRR